VLEFLLAALGHLGEWSYLLIFVGATLESAAFLGLLVPGESLVVFSGFLAAQGVLAAGDLIVVVAAGAILGDSIGYELGRRLGRPWLSRYGRWIGLRAPELERVDSFFARHGGKAVFLGRFLGVLRALAPFVAGASRLRYHQFLPYNILGGILWALSRIALGYCCGASWQAAERGIGMVSAMVGGAVLLAVALLWLWHRRPVEGNN
jgi:membrane protein DedA with SNARE-associated domain